MTGLHGKVCSARILVASNSKGRGLLLHTSGEPDEEFVSLEINSSSSSTEGRARSSQGLAPRSPRDQKLEHDPEKCEAVFRKDHAQTII
jgi:hypothetical protein